jgi:hypothetical protein
MTARRDEIADRDETDGRSHRERQAHCGDRLGARRNRLLFAMVMLAETARKPVPARQHRDDAEEDRAEKIVGSGRGREERGIRAQPGYFAEGRVIHGTANVGRGKQPGYRGFAQRGFDVGCRCQVTEIQQAHRDNHSDDGTCTRDQECPGHASRLEQHVPQVGLEQEQRDEHRHEVGEHEIEGGRRVRNDAQVGNGDRRKNCDHRSGQVRTDAGSLCQKRDAGNDEQHRHQCKVVVGADEGHGIPGRTRQRHSLVAIGATKNF